MKLVLSLHNVYKKYKSNIAVDHVSMQTPEGTITGIIGADGAGKSTLLKIISGLLPPDEGTINILGYEYPQHSKFIRNVMGYMPQKFSLYQDLSVAENLKFFGKMYGVGTQKQVELEKRLYEFSKLESFQNRRAGNLSGGMKQKLALSCTLLNEPKLLLLDEPTFGVDPVSRQELWEILFELKQSGMSILVSTAYLDEAEKCDTIYLMQSGKMIIYGTMQTLQQSIQNIIYQVSQTESNNTSLHSLKFELRKIPSITHIQQLGNYLHITTEKEDRDLIQTLNQMNLNVERIQPTIADVFFKYAMNRETIENERN